MLGPNASDVERHELKQKLGEIGQFLLDWQNTYNQTIAGKKTYDGKEQQRDTEEGFGRLDALNRIGNQVFSQDFALSGVKRIREEPARAGRARQLPADLDRAVVQVRAI